jgi:TonB family protein
VIATRGALVALAVALVAGAAAAEVVPPVPLRTPPPLVPEQTAGHGLTPEAAVRVAIDARGRVERVEVLSIAPSSEFDDLFRAELVATLSDWRYAPQIRDGVAEGTTLEWRVRFPARAAEDEPERSLEQRLARGLEPAWVPGLDAEARRARILALPEQQRLALLEAETSAALRLLDRDRVVRHASARFLVTTDAGGAEVAAGIAGNLEAIFNVLAHEILPGIELAPEKYKIQVVVYRSREPYLQLTRELDSYEWSAGFYSPSGLIAFHLAQPTNAAVMSLMLHEATHAFLDRHVVRRGVALPRWLSEGFADYVGNSDVRRGKLTPGKIRRAGYHLVRAGGAVLVETGAAQQVDQARQALRRGEGLGVEALLTASAETFYGENRDLFYASAWLLTHFLRDGTPGGPTGRFVRFLLYLAEGYPQEQAFAAVYGSAAELDREFREYVRSF